MTTQKRGMGNILASVAVGVAIIAACGLGLYFVDGGSFTGLFGGVSSAKQGSVEVHTVTDSVGRTVEVPADPQHIAAMDAFSGNVCVLSGAGEKLMGAPGGVASNELLQKLCPSLGDIQQLSGNSINVETLMAAGVDAALVKRDLYDGGEETAKLDKLGIPYVVVDYGTVEEQMEAISLVGQVCGVKASVKAESIAAYYRATVKTVEERSASLAADQKRRVYHSINDSLLTDGAGSLGADWIERTGAIDVSADQAGVGGMGDYSATLEQVYAWNPEVIVCNTAATRASIESDAQWQGMAAVTAKSVYNLPVSTSRWGQRGDPETFLGMLWLGKTLYPGQYEDIDLEETVVAYYRDIIGLDIDAETWGNIVAGQGVRAEGSGGQEGSGSGSGGGGGK